MGLFTDTAAKASVSRPAGHSQKSFKNFLKGSAAIAALPYVLPTVGAGGGTAAGTATAANAANTVTQGSRVGGALKAVGSFLPAALGVYSAYEGNQADKRAQAMQDKALALAEQRYAEMAPLRQMGLQRLQSAQRPDLSYLDDTGNPYTRRIPRVGGGA